MLDQIVPELLLLTFHHFLVEETIIYYFTGLLIQGRTIIPDMPILLIVAQPLQLVIDLVHLIGRQAEQTRVEVGVVAPLPPPSSVENVPL